MTLQQTPQSAATAAPVVCGRWRAWRRRAFNLAAAGSFLVLLLALLAAIVSIWTTWRLHISRQQYLPSRLGSNYTIRDELLIKVAGQRGRIEFYFLRGRLLKIPSEPSDAFWGSHAHGLEFRWFTNRGQGGWLGAGQFFAPDIGQQRDMAERMGFRWVYYGLVLREPDLIRRRYGQGFDIELPLYAIILSSLPMPIIWLIANQRQRRAARNGLCRACGYDLRGSPVGGPCPECGSM